MDSIVTHPRPAADERFDTARITAAVDALAATHSGREDVFRAAMAQLLKVEMIQARAVAQAVLLQDCHRRLWPRADGAGVRYRSVVHPALQANRLGRAGRRGYSVLPVGHGPEGRPRDALGR